MAFPPNLPNIEHVVINSPDQEEPALRTLISSTISFELLNKDVAAMLGVMLLVTVRTPRSWQPSSTSTLKPACCCWE